MPRCVACLQGLTWECENNCATSTNTQVHNEEDTDEEQVVVDDIEEDSSITSEIDDFEPNGPVVQIRTHNDNNLKDQQSTGRKRAAKMYPLDRSANCEWYRQKNCGGGHKPIVGCVNGKQQARHHGPDKNTLNNDYGNVHRICHTCHNRWHTENDEDYVWASNQPPHEPCACEMVDLGLNELYWSTRTVVTARD